MQQIPSEPIQKRWRDTYPPPHEKILRAEQITTHPHRSCRITSDGQRTVPNPSRIQHSQATTVHCTSKPPEESPVDKTIEPPGNNPKSAQKHQKTPQRLLWHGEPGKNAKSNDISLGTKATGCLLRTIEAIQTIALEPKPRPSDLYRLEYLHLFQHRIL